MVALRKSIHYVYDPATQRHTETWTGTSYADAVTDIVYGYNSMGELASVTVLKENGQTPATVASSDKYDAVGNITSTTLPNTVYTYDAGGRLTNSFNSAVGITTSYTYKPNTNYISTETVTRNLSPVTLAVYSYTYRADGLKTGETDTTYNSDGTVNDTRTLSWQYDGLDRVTQETSSDTAGTAALNYTDLYQYDLNSNRVKETVENASGTVTDTITSSYNANDELTQAVDANTGTTVYTYDANGSQIETQHTPSGGTSPDTTTTNEYDLQGQMAGTQTTNSTGTTKATYEYDDSGNRIIETNTNTAGTTTTMYYLVDTQNPNGYPQPIEQAATPGSPQITYVWGKTLTSQTYATGATIPGVGTATSPTTYYILTDAHGSTRIITDSSGVIAQRLNYDAFGNALGFNASTALTSYLYSSMSFDPASDNYYDDARFYTPGTGMFDQRDYGYSGQLTNPMADLPYTFAGGDPVNMLDLNGHAFSLGSLSISVSIMAGLNGILGASLSARNGIWGAAGGLVGGIDSTYISMFGSFLVGPPIAFGIGAAIGAVSELGITYGYDYLKTLEARFTICLAGVVGSAIGYVAGAGTLEIAERLGQSILDRVGMYQIVENAFRNTSEIEQAGLRNMVVFAVQHPLDTIGLFNKAVTGAVSEAAVDALKAFATKGSRKNNFALSGWFFWPRALLFAPYRPAGGVCASLTPRRRPKLLRRKIRIYFCAAPNGAVTLTDEVANYLVDEAQKFLQGLNNLAQQSQSEVP